MGLCLLLSWPAALAILIRPVNTLFVAMKALSVTIFMDLLVGGPCRCLLMPALMPIKVDLECGFPSLELTSPKNLRSKSARVISLRSSNSGENPHVASQSKIRVTDP